MFPHRFDRYRILYFILNHHLEKSGLTAAAFRRVTGLTQPRMSNLFNFNHVKRLLLNSGTPNQRPFNDDALQAACSCFGLSDSDTKTLFWLYGDHKRSDPHRMRVLAMLESIVRTEAIGINADAKKRRREIPVELFGLRGRLDFDEAERIYKKDVEDLHKKLAAMSKNFGHRMVVSKFPTSASLPEEIKLGTAAHIRTRKHNFLRNVGTSGCGERHIHSKPTIKRYLDPKSNCSHLSIDQRRKHVQNLISIIEDADLPNFQLALADHEPEIELAVTSLSTVGVRTTAREILVENDLNLLTNSAFFCGPTYVFLKDQIAVISCLLDFEREWNQIPRESKDRKSVKAWLAKVLSESIRRG